jgi:alanyl-tRNA synthetase
MFMTAEEIRKAYLKFFEEKGHKILPRAKLVPKDDPTTLFTGSGMQPLIPYLLGQPHPEGQRLVDSQTCFRAEDMDEVGDNRHTTFFEMLGNWSLGDYFKQEQLTWFWEFLTEITKLPKDRLWVTCFEGDERLGLPRDNESAKVWKNLGLPEERIKFYAADKNWWSREGSPDNMRIGEPGGPDSEVFYDFGTPHDVEYGPECHPNCDCGRFLEIGNSVFMTYRKTGNGFEELPQKNVDFGGGLERLAAATNNNPDIFQISLIKPIIDHLEELSHKKYADHQKSMRVITDHMRAAIFLIADGVLPSNKTQGYVLRRLLRRAILYARDLKLADNFAETIPQVAVSAYEKDFPEIKEQKEAIINAVSREAKLFTSTLERGHLRLLKILKFKSQLSGEDIFELYDTWGFPPELTIEVASRTNQSPDKDWQKIYDTKREEQRQRSQTASQGMFKGGLADHSEQVVRLHTATHLMYQALKEVLGSHVVQRGSNITAERTRFDFSHPQKVTTEEIKQIEDIVNKKIDDDLPVSWQEENTDDAFTKGASGAFGDKYGDKVKVYTIGNPENQFSREICGGPHVEHTGQIGEGGKKFKIAKEEASSAGVRRIKAILE